MGTMGIVGRLPRIGFGALLTVSKRIEGRHAENGRYIHV
jgi:hypothetical protein